MKSCGVACARQDRSEAVGERERYSIGTMEKNMETTTMGLYRVGLRDSIGIMEKKKETTTMGSYRV